MSQPHEGFGGESKKAALRAVISIPGIEFSESLSERLELLADIHTVLSLYEADDIRIIADACKPRGPRGTRVEQLRQYILTSFSDYDLDHLELLANTFRPSRKRKPDLRLVSGSTC